MTQFSTVWAPGQAQDFGRKPLLLKHKLADSPLFSDAALARLIEATPIDNPDVGVFGRKEHSDQYSDLFSDPVNPFGPPINQRTDSTTVGVRLRVPLPTPGRNEPRAAEAAAEITRARAEYERARRLRRKRPSQQQGNG